MGGGSGIAVSCGVGRRCGLDRMLLWLWHRPAAVALIQSLAWELPYAAGVALKSRGKNVEGKQPRFRSREGEVRSATITHGSRGT